VKILTLGGLVSFIFCFAYFTFMESYRFSFFPIFWIAFYALLVAILPFYLIFKTNRSIQSNSLFNQEIEFEIDSTLIKISYPNFEGKIILWSQIFKSGKSFKCMVNIWDASFIFLFTYRYFKYRTKRFIYEMDG
jgi:hypothetical protein